MESLCTFISNHLSQVLSSVGLLLDMVGAFFIAYEVVNKFKGQEYNPSPTTPGSIAPPTKTEQFSSWISLRNKVMITGLVLLTAGFSLQIWSNWV